MSDKPTVKASEWVSVGEPSAFSLEVPAIVCQVYEPGAFADIEVVYLDERDRAINEDVIWNGERWDFKIKDGTGGGYADKYDRLRHFVSVLRAGRRRAP